MTDAKIAVLAAIVTVGAAVTWTATGGHVFTKYESVEEIADPPAADDPFAAAGFYDDAPATRVVRAEGFHFGLLPASRSPFDKHAMSLTTVAAPLWILAVARVWRGRSRRRRGRGAVHPPRSFTCRHC